MSFVADFPGAIVVEAAKYGYPSKARGNNHPKGVGLHTPEEPADDNPSTPYYFHNLTDRNASTTYFVAWTGFVFQCVPEDAGAYGQGREGKYDYFPWEDPGLNLNLQSISIEIEGYASNIHLTMPRGSAQWVSLVRLIADICRRRVIPPDRIFGHYQVSIYRSDPGQLDLNAVKADVKTLLGATSMTPEQEKKLDDTYAKVEEVRKYLYTVLGAIDAGHTGALYEQRLDPMKAKLDSLTTGAIDYNKLSDMVIAKMKLLNWKPS